VDLDALVRVAAWISDFLRRVPQSRVTQAMLAKNASLSAP
jgi:hypothetical protein